jgi:hypothetical protein
MRHGVAWTHSTGKGLQPILSQLWKGWDVGPRLERRVGNFQQARLQDLKKKKKNAIKSARILCPEIMGVVCSPIASVKIIRQ